MKKMFLLLVVAIISTAASFAQNTLVATLTHGEDVTMYYGSYALRNAVNAAQSGDVINLSGGGFQSVNITKAVNLRGTGFSQTVPTEIVGSFTINIPSDDPNRFSMEGIRCQAGVSLQGTFENPYFLKCEVPGFYFESSPVIKNALFVNCRIWDYFSLYGSSSVQFINSYVKGFDNYAETSSSASFVNCVVQPVIGYRADYLKSCQFMNCIFFNYTTNNSYSLPSTSIASNCVAINDNNRMSNLFNNSQPNPNCQFSTYAEVFKNFDDWKFELTDEAKTKFLGTDGTEVGLYGGLMPYTEIPSYPRITKMNVASKTTADGKLSVEIEVSTAE